MRRERRAAHKRPPWPERVFHEEIEPLIHDPAPVRRAWTLILLGTLVALALTGGVLGVLRAAGVIGDDTGTSSQPHGTSSTPSPSLSATSTDRQALDDCHDLWSLQQQVLTAARPAMRQWDKHIDAMNQLVAGKITLNQAKAYWARTRVGATRNVDAFDATDERFRSTAGSLCAGVPASPTLKACLEAVEAGSATLESARTTIATWRHHIRDMERLRAGTLSPTMAQRMWLRNWKRGVEQLRVYRHDEAQFAKLSCRT